jgi:hypothetical protein
LGSKEDHQQREVLSPSMPLESDKKMPPKVILGAGRFVHWKRLERYSENNPKEEFDGS